MTDVKINTADGEQWARMYAIALKREQEFLAERDRMRRALKNARSALLVAIKDGVTLPGFAPENTSIIREIDAALAQGGQDE